MGKETILIVEDEKALVKVLRYNLENSGYKVAAAHDGAEGLLLFQKAKPDLAILDVMLPKLDGFELCKIIRQKHKTPILFLTAKKDEVDRVLGLELGADDYLTKPFSVRELLARVKAVLRRFSAEIRSPAAYSFGNLKIDLERYEVRVGAKTAALSSKEFEFLKFLAQAEGKAVSRDVLLEKIWGHDRSMEIDTRTADQYIARLRNKLQDESGRLITVKNIGYRLKTD
ncbi:MAG: response regulator transcription factor [Elusimicrobia bacterium]|nr:response regulator transcription factor [Elusimicrobiota bacterium]